MNYYEHHIGDYAEATSHLSFIEDAAYSRLIRKYYSSEKPLPVDMKAVQRLVGARTEEEREAVSTVLDEFFTLQDDGWHNQRCDEEIARYLDKQGKAKRSANARWNKPKTHSDDNANAMRTHSDDNANAMRTHSDDNANAMRTHSEGNAHQTPDTRHQTPDSLSQSGNTHTEIYSEQGAQARVDPPDRTLEPSRPTASAAPGTTAGECCKAMAQAGVAGCNPSHPTLVALIEAGASAQEFTHAARLSVGKGKCNFAYVIGTVKRQREEAAKLVLHQGRMPNKQEALENSNRAVASRWVPPEFRHNESKTEAA